LVFLSIIACLAFATKDSLFIPSFLPYLTIPGGRQWSAHVHAKVQRRRANAAAAAAVAAAAAAAASAMELDDANEAHAKLVPSSSLPASSSAAAVSSSSPLSPPAPLQEYLVLQDLTAPFRKPCILDLKIGTRQHGDDDTALKVLSKTRRCEATT
jgi:hypothetical protein